MTRGIPVREIAAICGGTEVAHGPDTTISQFLLDSRKISAPDHAVFIAIRGEHHDGHQYVESAWKSGVRNFIADRDVDLTKLKESTVIRVDNTISALQALARHHRDTFSIPMIGITGSNGKTVVKEWLNLLLADEEVICRSPRSYNSQVGVPLSVLNLDAGHTLGIFEAGISQPGEMDALRETIRPTIGILTTIGQAHIENFSRSTALIAREKSKLFSECHLVVCSSDIPEAVQAIRSSIPEHCSLFTWSLTGPAELSCLSQHTIGHKTELHLKWNHQEFTVVIPFTDSASIENVMTCLSTLLALGRRPDFLQDKLDRLVPLDMRLQQLEGQYGSVLVNDSYSSDIHSLEVALDHARSSNPGRTLTVILSDIPQTGIVPSELYAQVNSLLLRKHVNTLIGIGPNIRSASSSITVPSQFYDSVLDFLENSAAEQFAGHCILVKGSRHFQFEQIIEHLQEQTHETVLEINLNAIAHNLHYFRSRLNPDTRLMVMVKAFGYGSGAREVASLLEFNQVDYLAVAYADEGVSLRRSGISLPIMVMNPEKGSLYSLLKSRLEPEIYSFRTLHDFIGMLHKSGLSEPYPVHIKLDTGMHRLGFGASDIPELIRILSEEATIKVHSVFTHLAASEDSNHDSFTISQLEKFEDLCALLMKGLGYSFMRHALNTGGIQRFSGAQYEMVRLGIGLYGVSSHASEQEHLQVVSTLRTVISQIKTIHEGESVGYGRRFIAPRTMRIATIPLGYADGLRRVLSNGVGTVYTGGKRAPIIGSVCMDMTMIDITDIDVREGDPVEIFGSKLPLEELASRCGTIPYEILTSISQRVKRVYLQE